MGMNLQPGEDMDDDGIVDINTTPLIDVMLVLLIMLIVTVPLQTQSVTMDLPRGNPPPTLEKPQVVRIGVDFDDSLTWDGAPVPDQAELGRRLAELVAQNPRAELHITPDRLANYAVVSKVLAQAQNAGVTRFGIVQRK